MPEKRLKFLARDPCGVPGDNPIFSMQRALEGAGVVGVHNARSWPTRQLARVLARAGLMRRVADLSGTAYFVPIMLLSEGRLFPHAYLAEMIVYVFDCWPALYPRWERFFRRHRMRVAFFSARASAEHFRRVVPGMESIWQPEAVEPSLYRGNKPLAERSIDVLELGRRWDEYHDRIVGPLAAGGRSHKFQSAPGRIIFPTFAEMVGGFADAKISVCFPSSLTHPARSGHVETVTHRYFESMASRCIIVGRAPAELVDLFGYDPVVAADLDDPVGQLEDILREPAAHAARVERNHSRMLEVGTWEVRIATILDQLRDRGYRV
jgi:hypothetical protein